MGLGGKRNQLRGKCQNDNQLNTAFSLQPVQVTNRCNAHDLLAAFGVQRRAQPPGLDLDAHVARRVQSRRWPTIEASKALPAKPCAAAGPEGKLYRPLPLQSEIKLVAIFTCNSKSILFSSLHSHPPVLHSKMPISRNPQQQRERADVNSNAGSSFPTIPISSLAGRVVWIPSGEEVKVNAHLPVGSRNHPAVVLSPCLLNEQVVILVVCPR